ncbi:hypothetical protein DM790_22600 [Flavobacterium collinsii]|nr:hypothetical protein [Flavobacterium collinsii]
MEIIKISTDKIEELFLFMNWFKENDLIKYKYGKNKNDNFHALFFTLGLISMSTFNRRLKSFSIVHKNSITFEKINQSQFL